MKTIAGEFWWEDSVIRPREYGRPEGKHDLEERENPCIDSLLSVNEITVEALGILLKYMRFESGEWLAKFGKLRSVGDDVRWTW